MKKYILLILSILILFSTEEVFAQDTVYSLNKYNEEELKYILNKDNSIITAGTIKDDNSKKVILIDYSKEGDINWKYIYKEEQDVDIYGLVNNYKENNPNGYLLVVNNIKQDNLIFLNVDLEGKLVLEKQLSLGTNIKLEKIIEEDNYYILIGQKDNHSFIAKYDHELNFIWIKEEQVPNTSLKNIILLDNNGYYGVLETKNEEDYFYRIIKYDLDGNAINEISLNFDRNIEPHLEKTLDSFIIYGITKEVKLSDDKIGSYYIVKYSNKDEEEWETIGNIPVDENDFIKIQAIINNNKIENYIVTLKNSSDNSIETIKLSNEGNLQDKIKKLKNNYYKINDFILLDNTLYYIGQINCPDNDNCDYNHNSLLLISSEDKVIEVKDNDSKNIIIVFIIVIALGLVAYITRKKYKLKKQ